MGPRAFRISALVVGPGRSPSVRAASARPPEGPGSIPRSRRRPPGASAIPPASASGLPASLDLGRLDDVIQAHVDLARHLVVVVAVAADDRLNWSERKMTPVVMSWQQSLFSASWIEPIVEPSISKTWPSTRALSLKSSLSLNKRPYTTLS